jgi:hypothetical protein
MDSNLGIVAPGPPIGPSFSPVSNGQAPGHHLPALIGLGPLSAGAPTTGQGQHPTTPLRRVALEAGPTNPILSPTTAAIKGAGQIQAHTHLLPFLLYVKTLPMQTPVPLPCLLSTSHRRFTANTTRGVATTIALFTSAPPLSSSIGPSLTPSPLLFRHRRDCWTPPETTGATPTIGTLQPPPHPSLHHSQPSLVISRQPHLAHCHPLAMLVATLKTYSDSCHRRVLCGHATARGHSVVTAPCHAPLAWADRPFLPLGRSIGPEWWPSTVSAFSIPFPS